MMDLFIIIYNNFLAIFFLIVLIVVFLYFFDKGENDKKESYTQKEISKKNLYLNRIDIIGNKVQVIFILILIIIGFSVYMIFG